jgi:hypothetical protein
MTTLNRGAGPLVLAASSQSGGLNRRSLERSGLPTASAGRPQAPAAAVDNLQLSQSLAVAFFLGVTLSTEEAGPP